MLPPGASPAASARAPSTRTSRKVRSSGRTKCVTTEDAGSAPGDGVPTDDEGHDSSEDDGGGEAASAAGATAGKCTIDDFGVEEVYALVGGMGKSFAEAAEVLRENDIDGKTLASDDFDEALDMSVADGGLGLNFVQKKRLRKEIEARR